MLYGQTADVAPSCLASPRPADPVAAQTGLQTVGAAVVQDGTRAKGQIYTVLLSMDGGKTFVAAPAASLPDGFVQTSFKHDATSALLLPRHVYGVTWDNGNHGWIFGNGFIIVRPPFVLLLVSRNSFPSRWIICTFLLARTLPPPSTQQRPCMR